MALLRKRQEIQPPQRGPGSRGNNKMKQVFRNFAKAALKKFNIAVIKYSTFQRYFENMGAVQQSELHRIEVLLALPNRHASQLLKLLRKSKAQFGQDLFVLSELEF